MDKEKLAKHMRDGDRYMEAVIVAAIAKMGLDRGLDVVYDGAYIETLDDLLPEIGATGEEHLRVGRTVFFLVYGNDPHEIIADHTMTDFSEEVDTVIWGDWMNVYDPDTYVFARARKVLNS